MKKLVNTYSEVIFTTTTLINLENESSADAQTVDFENEFKESLKDPSVRERVDLAKKLCINSAMLNREEYITHYANKFYVVLTKIGKCYLLDIKSNKEAFKGYIYRTDHNNTKTISALFENGSKCTLAEYSASEEVKFLHDLNEIKTLSKKECTYLDKKGNVKTKGADRLTVQFGKVNGKNVTIGVHVLICLMVYGFDKMKYVVMGNNSLLVVDHVNFNTLDNSINNLQIITRSENSKKRKSNHAPF